LAFTTFERINQMADLSNSWVVFAEGSDSDYFG